MNKFKIIFAGEFNNSEILSGPEKVAKRIFEEYTKTHDSVFLTYFQDGTKYSLFRKIFGFEEVCGVNNSLVIRTGILRFLLILLKEKPEIIHIVNFSRYTVIAFFAKFLTGTKIIFNIHGILRYEYKINNFAKNFTGFKNFLCEYLLINMSDRLIVPSKGTCILLTNYFRINKDKISVINNGADEIFFAEPAKSLKNSIYAKLKIVYIGSKGYSLQKNEKLFEEILELIEHKTEAYLIGVSNDFEIKNGLVSVIKRDKMDASSLKDFYFDKHIFISTSVFESFSISCAEASVSGLIPVIPSTLGISDSFENGFNAGIIDRLNSKAYIKTINEIYNSYSLYYKNLSDSDLGLFGWKNIIKSYMTIYGKTIAGNP